MLKDIITANQLSFVISQAAAPAFLAAASFLSVLVSHHEPASMISFAREVRIESRRARCR